MIKKHDVKLIIKQFETIYHHVVHESSSNHGNTHPIVTKKNPFFKHYGTLLRVSFTTLLVITASTLLYLHVQTSAVDRDREFTNSRFLTNHRSIGAGVELVSRLVPYVRKCVVMPLSFQHFIQLLLTYKYLILFPMALIEGPIITIIAGFIASLGYLNLPIACFTNHYCGYCCR